MNEAERKYFRETRRILQSNDDRLVKARLRELTNTGSSELLPLILDLLKSNPAQDIKQEIITMLGNLREQACTQIIAQFIEENHNSDCISEVVASCWQSRLDYSAHLSTFTNFFVIGNYQSALESFTVIEEMAWKLPENRRADCRRDLLGRIKEIDDTKRPLFNELINILDSGSTQNSEDYPDLYPDS